MLYLFFKSQTCRYIIIIYTEISKLVESAYRPMYIYICMPIYLEYIILYIYNIFIRDLLLYINCIFSNSL